VRRNSLCIFVTGHQIPLSSMIQVFRLNIAIPLILSYVFQLLVSIQWLTHIKCVFSSFPTSRVVAVVVDHSSEDAISVAKDG